MAHTILRFTYNGVTQQIDGGKYKLRIADGTLFFEAPFIVAGAPGSTFETAFDAVVDALDQDFQAFTLEEYDGSTTTTLLTWSHSANTGFLTKAEISKPGTRIDTAASARMIFTLTAQRQPQNSARAGRREASIAITKEAPDDVRTLTFTGTYTALSTPATALATYTAQVATWISTWLSAITTTGTWKKMAEPSAAFDDENKLLRFSITYREQFLTSTPNETTKGTFTVGTFVRMDPSSFGARLNLGSAGGGEPSPLPGAGERTVIPGEAPADGYSLPTPVPRRYSVTTTTFHNTPADNLNTYFDATIRPWITATVQAIFGSGRVIFESHSEPIEDVSNNRVTCQAQILVAASGDVIHYEESAESENNRNLAFEQIWSGISDDFDLAEGGRVFIVVHRVTQVRLDSTPVSPDYLGAPFQFLNESTPISVNVIDPRTQRVAAVKTTHTRRYLYAPLQTARQVVNPSPLGSAAGAGGVVFTRGSGSGTRGTETLRL